MDKRMKELAGGAIRGIAIGLAVLVAVGFLMLSGCAAAETGARVTAWWGFAALAWSGAGLLCVLALWVIVKAVKE